jgi:integrase
VARRPTNNPRQVRSKDCGCSLCIEVFPPEEHGDRRPRRDCTGRWQARYRDASGHQRGPMFDTLKEAQAHLDAARAAVRAGTYQDPKRGAIRVEDWYKIWWPTQAAKGAVTTKNRKVSTWRAHVQPKWGRRKLNSITWIEVQGWISNEVKGRATQLKALELLRHMMLAAMRDNRIKVNPTADIEVSAPAGKHPDDLMPPTHTQCDLIREHLRDYYRPVVTFAEETGMRWGEYTALRRCHIDLDAATVKVKEVLTEDNGRLRRKPAPKTQAGFRTVPLTPAAVAAVEVMLEAWHPSDTEADPEDEEMLAEMRPEELVFRGPQGGLLSRHNFRRQWIPAIQEAKIARKVKNPETKRLEWWPRVHDLRHTFATRLKDAGVPEKDVQVIMGHERGGKVTWLYQHAGPELVEEVRAALVKGRALRVVA